MRDIIRLTVNGDVVETGVPTHYTLLETLRYILGLTGSKQGCDKGDCGACTVLMDGEAVLSCLLPVQEAAGRSVVTVEGLAAGPRPSALQEAFDLTGAAQCGFCTPGILCSATQLLAENPDPDRAAHRGGPGRKPLPVHGLHEDLRSGRVGRRGDPIGSRPGGRSGREEGVNDHACMDVRLRRRRLPAG